MPFENLTYLLFLLYIGFIFSFEQFYTLQTMEFLNKKWMGPYSNYHKWIIWPRAPSTRKMQRMSQEEAH